MTHEEGSRAMSAEKRSTHRCPTCGSPLVPIVYGLPGRDLLDAATRGEVIIGGCIIDVDDPTEGCPVCSR